MDRIVLDTNTFISGVTLSSSPPSKIINAWRKGQFVLITSPQILKEVEEVLLRPEIRKYTGLSQHEVDEFLSEIKNRAYVTEGIYEVWKIKNDPDDNIILACALEGYADFIVSGDKRSLLVLKEFHQIRILTPADYISKIL